jgi:hypothetical protein
MENRLILAFLVVVGRKAPVTRMLESAGPAQRRSSSPIEDDGEPGGSAEDQESGLITIRRQEYILSFLGVPCAQDLASRGGLLACWRQLETARPGEDLTLRRCCRNRASVVAKSWRGRLECLGDGAQ